MEKVELLALVSAQVIELQKHISAMALLTPDSEPTHILQAKESLEEAISNASSLSPDQLQALLEYGETVKKVLVLVENELRRRKGYAPYPAALPFH